METLIKLTASMRLILSIFLILIAMRGLFYFVTAPETIGQFYNEIEKGFK